MSATESKAQLENQALSVATYKSGLHPCKNLQRCAGHSILHGAFSRCCDTVRDWICDKYRCSHVVQVTSCHKRRGIFVRPVACPALGTPESCVHPLSSRKKTPGSQGLAVCLVLGLRQTFMIPVGSQLTLLWKQKSIY